MASPPEHAHSVRQSVVFGGEDKTLEEVRAYIGLEVRKETISVAAADAGQVGEVRHVGTIENEPTSSANLLTVSPAPCAGEAPAFGHH